MIKVVSIKKKHLTYLLYGVLFFTNACKENRISGNYGLKQARNVIPTKLIDKQEVYNNIDLIQKHGDSLFFFDFFLSQFHIYGASDLQYISSFGKYGPAPFEYNNVIKYKIKDSTVISYDNEAKLIKEQIIGSNTILESKKVPIDFNSFSSNKNQYLISTQDNDNLSQKFMVMTKDFSSSKEIKIPNKYKFNFSTLSYNGYFLENDNIIIYFVFETDHFLIFDKEFNYQGELDLIYNTQTPIYTRNNDGSFSKDEYSKEVNNFAALDDNYLYVLSSVDTERDYFIDAYNLHTLTYEKSFAIPKFTDSNLREFLFTENYLYLINHQYLAKLKI